MIATERLEALELLLDKLRVDNANTPLLVEGPRDRAALEALGCTGHIHLVNDGGSLLDTAERLARRYDRIILLSDWDRTGGSIHRRMRETLEAYAVRCDETYRRDLARLLRKETRTVEGVPGALRRLRELAGRA